MVGHHKEPLCILLQTLETINIKHKINEFLLWDLDSILNQTLNDGSKINWIFVHHANFDDFPDQIRVNLIPLMCFDVLNNLLQMLFLLSEQNSVKQTGVTDLTQGTWEKVSSE